MSQKSGLLSSPVQRLQRVALHEHGTECVQQKKRSHDSRRWHGWQWPHRASIIDDAALAIPALVKGAGNPAKSAQMTNL